MNKLQYYQIKNKRLNAAYKYSKIKESKNGNQKKADTAK